VTELLHGMHNSDVAGILGTPKNKDARYFLRVVYDFNVEVYFDELPAWLREIKLVPALADATYLFAHKGNVRFNDAARKSERDALVLARSEDGTDWIEDPSAPKDWEIFKMWHAAFRLDYREWLRQNR